MIRHTPWFINSLAILAILSVGGMQVVVPCIFLVTGIIALQLSMIQIGLILVRFGQNSLGRCSGQHACSTNLTNDNKNDRPPKLYATE